MATCTLQNVYDAARSTYLNDTQVTGGEVYTNAVLQGPFGEAYRRMFNCLAGTSKRIEKYVYVNLPAYTTALIPASHAITDMAEPEFVEERPATIPITITSTSASTPIQVTAPNHGLPNNAEIVVSEVQNTWAPWGQWFITVVDANNFTLNGSYTDGISGSGGYCSVANQLNFVPVYPVDQAYALDGQPTQYLGVYWWGNSQFQFRGANETQQLRITYWASGAPPINPSQNLGIDNCLDFLACATAATAAKMVEASNQLADALTFKAFGASEEAKGDGGLLGDFVKIQILTLQRTQRRRLPFRQKISRWGNYVVN